MRLVAGFSILLAACSGPDSGRGFAVRDSAGITIAESTMPAWADSDGWRLAAEPELQIGVIEGDSAYQFFQLLSGKFLSDGRIVAVNAGTNALRVFGPDGRFEREIGREGEAPGEFRGLSGLSVWPGDSLLAFDAGLGRLTLFDPGGKILDMIVPRLPPTEQFGGFLRLGDGTLLMTSGWSPMRLAPSAGEQIQRLPTPVLHFARDGELRDTVGPFPGMEIVVQRSSRGAMVGPPPFGRSLAIAVHDDELYVGTGEELAIRVITPDGALRRIIRVPGYDLTITAADIARVRETMLAEATSDAARAFLEEFLANAKVPEKRAAFNSFRVDDEGNLWTSGSDLGRLALGNWNVFGPDGRWLGEFTMPDQFRMFDIRNGRMLGRWRDDADVDYLRVYRIEKG